MPHRPLTDYRPTWLAIDGRERLGLELDCPGPMHSHRIRIWLANPDQGAPASALERDGEPVFWFLGDDLAELTIMRPHGSAEEPINIPGHFRGWIVDGLVVESFISGIGW